MVEHELVLCLLRPAWISSWLGVFYGQSRLINKSGVVVVGSVLLWMFSKRRSKGRREQEVAESMRRVFDELAKKRAEQDVHRKVVGR